MASPASDFVTRREFERFTDSTDQRWNDLVVKLDQLTNIVIVEKERTTAMQKNLQVQGEQGFTKSVTGAQLGVGCLISAGLIFLQLGVGIVTTILVNWVTHR